MDLSRCSTSTILLQTVQADHPFVTSGRLFAIANASGWTDLLYAGGARIAEVAGSQAATPTYAVLDHLGSEVATVDNGGNVLSSLDYSPFGQVISGSNADGFIFTGLLRDNTGLDHADFRQYSSITGRWITPDPYDGSYDASNPQSMNRYGYVGNMPLFHTDSSGLCSNGNDNVGGGTMYDSDGNFIENVNGGPCNFRWLDQIGSWIKGLFVHPPKFRGNVPAQNAGKETRDTHEERGFFTCAADGADTISIATGLHQIPGLDSGAGGFFADALGGNPYSGVTDLVNSVRTGEGGDHSVFYNMGEGLLAGPTQGFSVLLPKSLQESPIARDAVGTTLEALPVIGEYASGFGELKFGYDTLSYLAGSIDCGLGVIH